LYRGGSKIGSKKISESEFWHDEGFSGSESLTGLYLVPSGGGCIFGSLS